MKAVAINDFYDIILTDDDGNMLDVTDMEPTDYLADAYIARGVADDDPDGWERKAREEARYAGFELGELHDDTVEKWFDIETR